MPRQFVNPICSKKGMDAGHSRTWTRVVHKEVAEGAGRAKKVRSKSNQSGKQWSHLNSMKKVFVSFQQ